MTENVQQETEQHLTRMRALYAEVVTLEDAAELARQRVNDVRSGLWNARERVMEALAAGRALHGWPAEVAAEVEEIAARLEALFRDPRLGVDRPLSESAWRERRDQVVARMTGRVRALPTEGVP